MSRESFFTDVILSYKKLSSTPAGKFITLQAYCSTRHVAYNDFIRWASASAVASELPEISQQKKRTIKAKASHKASSVGTDRKDANMQTRL